MTFDQERVWAMGAKLYDKYNEFGRGRITIEQFIVLYLENKLDDYIEKVKKETEVKQNDKT